MDIYDDEFEEDFIAKPRLVNKTDAAALLGISKPTLYKWIKNNKFPIVKVGGIERIDMIDVEKWLQSMKTVVEEKGWRDTIDRKVARELDKDQE